MPKKPNEMFHKPAADWRGFSMRCIWFIDHPLPRLAPGATLPPFRREANHLGALCSAAA
jgi:hypothetical protein